MTAASHRSCARISVEGAVADARTWASSNRSAPLRSRASDKQRQTERAQCARRGPRSRSCAPRSNGTGACRQPLYASKHRRARESMRPSPLMWATTCEQGCQSEGSAELRHRWARTPRHGDCAGASTPQGTTNPEDKQGGPGAPRAGYWAQARVKQSSIHRAVAVQPWQARPNSLAD